MDKLAGRRFDLAFVPLDPRQEDGFGFGEGLQLFLQTASAEVVFPYAFWGRFFLFATLRGVPEKQSCAMAARDGDYSGRAGILL